MLDKSKLIERTSIVNLRSKKLEISKLANNEDIPKTPNTLYIFEPNILPIAKSVCFFIAAKTPVTNSGRDVPIATIVIPIIVSDKPKFLAISVASLINILEP